MNGCTHDCQSCGGCSGCGGGCLTTREVVLTREEAALLLRFSAVPYLPICRTGDALLFPAGDMERAGKTALALAGRGLVSLDEDLPLSGCDYSEFPPAAESRGSAALTPLGQAVLEELPDLL